MTGVVDLIQSLFFLSSFQYIANRTRNSLFPTSSICLFGITNDQLMQNTGINNEIIMHVMHTVGNNYMDVEIH